VSPRSGRQTLRDLGAAARFAGSVCIFIGYLGLRSQSLAPPRLYAVARSAGYGAIRIVPVLLMRVWARMKTMQVPAAKLFGNLTTTCVNSEL